MDHTTNVTSTATATASTASTATSGGSNTTAARYQQALEPLTAVIEAVPADRWAAPSPCEGWAARDIVRHLVGTQRDFLGAHGSDLGPTPDIDADPAAGWRTHAQRVVGLIGDDAVPALEFDGHFGRTTVGATLEQFYIFDMVVHRWDIAKATGGDDRLTEDELDRIEQSADSFGGALYMEGVCRPGVAPSEEAGRQGHVLARLGRRA